MHPTHLHCPQVPLWRQRSAAAPGQPVVWDYHVFLLAQLAGHSALVLDLDRCGSGWRLVGGQSGHRCCADLLHHKCCMAARGSPG